MALIGQIRKRGSWILVVLIALGLGGFIIQDMLISGPNQGMGSQTTNIGKVNGEDISLQEFNRVENLVLSGSNDVYAQRNDLWNFFVENTILEQRTSKMGLGVPTEELDMLQFGPSYSPIVIQNFPNPQAPGLPNTQQLNQLRDIIKNGGIDGAIANGQLSPNFRAIWRHQENMIIKDRLQTKLSNMISKGMYTPSWMAEDLGAMQNQTVSFAYVKVPFDELDNTEVSLSDADFKAYLSDNAEQFERDEEMRRLSYVTFTVEATSEDTAAVRAKVQGMVSEFAQAENDTNYVEQNQGLFLGAYQKQSQLSPAIREVVTGLEVGEVYGPYFEQDFFKAVKVMDKMTLPDSVRARHILLRVNPQDPSSLPAARNRIDSIKAAIESGSTTFAAMNDIYNDDVVAQGEGGDLGYAGLNAMVKPFNDLIFYEAEQGELYTVLTQFGMHLVEVMGKKYETNEAGYLLGIVQEEMIPSESTQKEKYNEAFAFMTDNRNLEAMTAAAGENPELTVERTNAFDANAYQVGFTIPSGSTSREMVKWAFGGDAKMGKVASYVYEFSDPVRYFDNQYLVVALSDIMKPGMPAVDEVRNNIEPAVANIKKGEVLSQALQGKSLADAASAYGTEVDTLNNVSFNTSFLQDVGNEPKLVGEAFKLAEGQTSGPIVGNTGVYVLSVLSKTAPQAPTANIPQLRQQFNATARTRVPNQLMATLREQAKIKDNRSAFY
jgi:peptidyl-prolyl cis-trans isomerase D